MEVKYGRRLEAAYAQPGGEHLRRGSTRCPTSSTSHCSGWPGDAVRKQFLDGAPEEVAAFVRNISDDELVPLVTDLGGHDLDAMLDAYRQCDAVTDRPSVVFAYTIKGWGLPIAGNPRNHSALLTKEQIDMFRAEVGLDADSEWDRLDPPAGRHLGQRATRGAARPPREPALPITVPESTGCARASRSRRKRCSVASSSTSRATTTLRRTS